MGVKANNEKLRKIAEENKQRVENKRQQELRDRGKKAAEFESENRHLLEEREKYLNALEAQMKDDFGFSPDENEEFFEEVDKKFDEDEMRENDKEEVDYLDELYCAA